MVVALDVGVEAGGEPDAVDAGREPEAHEPVERAVDGRPIDLGEAAAHVVVQRLRRRMVVPREQGVEHDTPLRGQGEAALPAQGDEAVQLGGGGFAIHVAKYTQLRTDCN